jgi:hypothetical protein
VLLGDALALLKRHAAAVPAPANSVKAQYLIDRRTGPSFDGHNTQVADWLRIAYQVPWERERQVRISRAIRGAMVTASLRDLQEPVGAVGRNPDGERYLNSRRTASLLLLRSTGPGGSLSVQHWAVIMRQFEVNNTDGVSELVYFLWPSVARVQLSLRVTQLLTATALYQAEHGSPPEKLDALLDGYLSAIPNDPWNDRPFGYRISKGEKSENETPPLTLAPGQAVLYIEHGSGLKLYAVPRPAKP